MRTINYYKAFGILALGAFTAIATAQNRRSNEAEPPRTHEQGQVNHPPASNGSAPSSTQSHVPQPASPSTQSRSQFAPGGYRPSGNPAVPGGSGRTFGSHAAGQGGGHTDRCEATWGRPIAGCREGASCQGDTLLSLPKPGVE